MQSTHTTSAPESARLAPPTVGFDSPATKMLFALQGRTGHIYAGTVPDKVKQRRRAANKVARRTRATNRGR